MRAIFPGTIRRLCRRRSRRTKRRRLPRTWPWKNRRGRDRRTCGSYSQCLNGSRWFQMAGWNLHYDLIWFNSNNEYIWATISFACQITITMGKHDQTLKIIKLTHGFQRFPRRNWTWKRNNDPSWGPVNSSLGSLQKRTGWSWWFLPKSFLDE